MLSVLESMFRSTIPIGGGLMPIAISVARAAVPECVPPHTPQARLVM